MYSSVRRLGCFSFILALLNVIAAILLLFYFADLPFAARFTWILYTATASLGFLFLSWALFDLSKVLENEYTSNSQYLHKLNKRIKDLEDKLS